MIYVAKQASDQTIARLLADPSLIHAFVSLDIEHSPAALEPSWLGRLLGRKRAELPPSFDDDAKYGDLDKAWHGLHYLFTGTAWEGDMPASFLLAGGEAIGTDEEHDVGYGCARAYTADQTRSILAFLRSLNRDVLTERFDPQDMMRVAIYPSIWDRDPADDDTLGYLLEYYDSLTEFVSHSVDRDVGMVVWLG